MTEEMVASRSVMIVDVTDIDIGMAAKLFVGRNIEEDLVTQFFRLKGNRFIMVINSVLSVERWDTTIKPEIVALFGEERCRFETYTPSKLLDELLEREVDRRDNVEEC